MPKRRDIISIGKYHSGKLRAMAVLECDINACDAEINAAMRRITRLALDAYYEQAKK